MRRLSLHANAKLKSVTAHARTTNIRQRYFASDSRSYPGDSHVLRILEERGLVNQIAGDRGLLGHILQSKKIAIYSGIDPTAPSLHLGHLLPLIVLFWLRNYGHHAISLVGAGTAQVGDPSGRLTSRARISQSVRQDNARSMQNQLAHLWEYASLYSQRHGFQAASGGKAETLDNSVWLRKLNVLDFLDVLGCGMRMGTMLGKDTVRNKMERGDGMSFAEFSYPLLQAWDWWHMYRERNVLVQVGGGDQYGNIIAGMEAVRYAAQRNANEADCAEWFDGNGKLREEYAPVGLTVPLLTTSSGEKFGKSAGNAIWLDQDLTSAFDLYGFLLSSADADVERYLKLFTFLPLAHISATMTEHQANPERRIAQHLLASEVLELVHGREVAQATRSSHENLRSPTLANLQMPVQASAVRPLSSPQRTERTRIPSSFVTEAPFSRILYHAGIAATKSEGSRMIAQGGVYVATATKSTNDETPGQLQFEQIRPNDPLKPIECIIDGLLVLRIGKWKVRVIELVEEPM